MKKTIIIVLIIIILFIIVIFFNGIYCNNHLEVLNYNLTTSKIDINLHFVVISDQHNKEFGENNQKLLDKIKGQNPDFIVTLGDMVTRGYDDDSVMKTFLKQASEIAPTYCVLGNHEREMIEISSQIDIISDIAETGAILLDNQAIEFEKNGDKIIIGGLTDYPFYEAGAPSFENENRYFWDEINEKSADNYSILLHHQPEFISMNLDESNIDLVLCGHTHGGLIRIPFIGGLLAPNQGIFEPSKGLLPKYTKGEYDFNNTKMIISSGVGNPSKIPRINNCAEITVVDVN